MNIEAAASILAKIKPARRKRERYRQRLAHRRCAGLAGAAGGAARRGQRNAGSRDPGPWELPQQQPYFGHPAQ